MVAAVDLPLQVHGSSRGPTSTGPWLQPWTYLYRSMVADVDLPLQVHGSSRGPTSTGPWLQRGLHLAWPSASYPSHQLLQVQRQCDVTTSAVKENVRILSCRIFKRVQF